MELSRRTWFISSLVLLLSFAAGFVSAKAAHKKPLFVFGDSLFDPGNNQYLNSSEATKPSWPYGQTYFKRPTGRLSDGRIVPDFVAQFARLPILPPYLQPGTKQLRFGANFASAGAGVLTETHPGTVCLRQQLSYFKDVKKTLTQQLGAAATERLLGEALYLFSMGGNDYFGFYRSHSNATQLEKRAYVATVTGNLSEVLQEIYDMGGRKIGFQNAGPLGCAPGMKTMMNVNATGCISGLSELAHLHNMALSKVLKHLESKNPGFKYSIFDYYNSLFQRVTNPSKYGFKNGADACYESGMPGNKTFNVTVCSNPSEYVWFDGGHTTQRANYQLAQLIWAGLPDVTGPYNFRQFIGM